MAAGIVAYLLSLVFRRKQAFVGMSGHELAIPSNSPSTTGWVDRRVSTSGSEVEGNMA
jgi:hypothetical protein